MEREEDKQALKILSCNNIKPPVEGRCGFFVKRKQRYCKMLPTKGSNFCAEHLCEDKQLNNDKKRKRINCPLDPKHTVFEEKLTKHLKICNATLKTQLPYYTENINLGAEARLTCEEEKITLRLVPAAELSPLIDKIRTCYNQCTQHISTNASLHPILDEALNESGSGPSVKKHLKQTASLVNILQTLKSLDDERIIIEFGAGKGGLSHWVQKAMSDKQKVKFLLVDRQHNRHKLDCYHRGEDQGPSFNRLNIDIQHLNLGNVASLTDNDFDVTAIGKHLCGGATDLSLRCLMEACKSAGNETAKKQKQLFMSSRIHSILFALCCYHRCSWSTYVGHEFLKKYAFSELEFSRLTKMATWSTHCCPDKHQDVDSKNKEGNPYVDELKHNDTDIGTDHADLGLTSDEQTEVGRMCKRILDEGRLRYIRGHGYECELVKYINDDITPENIALIVRRSVDTND